MVEKNYKDKTKILQLVLQSGLHSKFKSRVALEGTDMTAKLKGWIRDYVDGKLECD